LPACCLRALRKGDWVSQGQVTSLAFVPEPWKPGGREDGGHETSISWEDDDTVLAFTMRRRDQSGYGVARLSRAQIDVVRQLKHCLGALSYERARLVDNHFHGNLVFDKRSLKPTQKMIAAALALGSEFVPREPGL
jgi:hypothetical protein